MLHEADAELSGAVEIRIIWNAHALQGFDIGARHRAGMAKIGNLQRSANAVEFAAEMIVVFLRLEIGQDIPVRPGAIIVCPRLGHRLVPAIIIGRLPAHVDHGVDRAAATQDFALRHDRTPAVQLFLRLGLMHGQIGVLGEKLHVARRKMHDRVGLAGAPFQHQNARLAIAHETRGNDAGRTAAAHDDIVVCRPLGHVLFSNRAGGKCYCSAQADGFMWMLPASVSPGSSTLRSPRPVMLWPSARCDIGSKQK